MRFFHSTFLTMSAVIILHLLLFSSISFADSDGRTGRTLKSGTSGCGSCHGSENTGISVTITGPDSVAINMENTYTVTITGGPLVSGGVDIASSTGALAIVSTDLKVVNGELTHTSPKLASSGAVTFQFKYTAPSTVGTQTLYSTGISCNNTGGTGGDQWKFALNKTIAVVASVPVELTSFTAAAEKNAVKLNWTTATELNNYGFQVEKKVNNLEWNNIGFIKGAGNSSSLLEYSFTDQNVSAKNDYTYRLNQVDVNGSNTYSQEVQVSLDLIPFNYSVSQNYPNPFNPNTTIKYSLPLSSFVSIKVYNSIGKEVANLVNRVQDAAEHSINFDGSKISSGIYYYTIKAGSFEQTRKMILLK